MQVRCHPAEELSTPLVSTLQSQTLLGSVPFASLWNSLGGEAVYWALYDADRPVALLPSVRFGSGRLARLQAMPDGLYARLILLDPTCNPSNAGRLILDAIKAKSYARTFVNDFFGQFPDAADFDKTIHCTTIVPLTNNTWQPPDKKLQSEIRKAQREDVPIDTFDPNRHFDAFLDLMRRTEKRHGRKPKYPPAFFEALSNLVGREERIRWLVCEQQGRLAASHIYFVEGDMLLNWQVYFDKEYSPLKPNQLITYSIACEMASRGVARLNLGASPDDADTLAAYKDKWGGEDYHYPIWSRRTWLGRLW
jgi:hypothetical protein